MDITTNDYRMQQIEVGIQRNSLPFADDVGFDAVFVYGYSDAGSFGQMESAVSEGPPGVGCVLEEVGEAALEFLE